MMQISHLRAASAETDSNVPAAVLGVYIGHHPSSPGSAKSTEGLQSSPGSLEEKLLALHKLLIWNEQNVLTSKDLASIFKSPPKDKRNEKDYKFYQKI